MPDTVQKPAEPAPERNDPPRPIEYHLIELRRRLIVIIATVAVTTGVSWWQYKWILETVERPLILVNEQLKLGTAANLQTFSPAEAFIFVMKIGVLAGLILASPMIIYQLWMFLSPGLTKREKGILLPVFAMGLIFFLAGATLAYFWVMPAALYYLALVAKNINVLYNLRLAEYTGFFISVIVAFGAAFELPLVMLGLGASGIVAPSAFWRPWRYVVVGAFVLGAVLTPPDVVSQIIMAAVLIILYTLGVYFAKIGARYMGRSPGKKE